MVKRKKIYKKKINSLANLFVMFRSLQLKLSSQTTPVFKQPNRLEVLDRKSSTDSHDSGSHGQDISVHGHDRKGTSVSGSDVQGPSGVGSSEESSSQSLVRQERPRRARRSVKFYQAEAGQDKTEEKTDSQQEVGAQ